MGYWDFESAANATRNQGNTGGMTGSPILNAIAVVVFVLIIVTAAILLIRYIKKSKFSVELTKTKLPKGYRPNSKNESDETDQE